MGPSIYYPASEGPAFVVIASLLVTHFQGAFPTRIGPCLRSTQLQDAVRRTPVPFTCTVLCRTNRPILAVRFQNYTIPFVCLVIECQHGQTRHLEASLVTVAEHASNVTGTQRDNNDLEELLNFYQKPVHGRSHAPHIFAFLLCASSCCTVTFNVVP